MTGFGGTIQLANAGATGDKWNATGLGTVPGSLVVDSGSTIFVSAWSPPPSRAASPSTARAIARAAGRFAWAPTTLGWEYQPCEQHHHQHGKRRERLAHRQHLQWRGGHPDPHPRRHRLDRRHPERKYRRRPGHHQSGHWGGGGTYTLSGNNTYSGGTTNSGAGGVIAVERRQSPRHRARSPSTAGDVLWWRPAWMSPTPS